MTTSQNIHSIQTRNSLAELVNKYYSEVSFYNAAPLGMSEKESDARATTTCVKTLRDISITPVVTSEDAVAAIDFLQLEGLCELGDGPFDKTLRGLLCALRTHVEQGH